VVVVAAVDHFIINQMEQFKHLDAKTIELAGIAASIAGGCRPCLDYHFKKAIEVGCTIEEAKEAVELGKMIKQRPIKDIYEQAEKLIGKSGNTGNLL
jgi:AhpD family alkylhydroperoxidase